MAGGPVESAMATDNPRMKVLDLQCEDGHRFEGWFASEDDFRAQLDRKLVECPFCGATQVVKCLSAPRLNFGASPEPTVAAPAPAGDAGQSVALASGPGQAGIEQAWLKLVRHVLEHTEDVGGRFADEARRIHYGESKERGIRGQASREETEALLDEGIAVLPLPIPSALKGPVQ